MVLMLVNNKETTKKKLAVAENLQEQVFKSRFTNVI